MKSKDLREKFFQFFIERGHKKIDSSSLIPANDPTLLFANAGMNQFKDQFLGRGDKNLKCAVSIQKCVRAGGKHNDLDNVGFTKRHLTFFEMMGNFSFGDYFKKESIKFSFDFLTQVVGFKKGELLVTVHVSDNDSYNIWKDEIGISQEKIFKLTDDNFWQMGDIGPCGPSTEIFIDSGLDVGCGSSDCSPACDCDRFLEIWNNVFMQFNRQEDGTDLPLAQIGVDTGMGLERLAMISQGKKSVFEADMFESMMKKIENLTGLSYLDSSEEIKTAFNVLVDHSRSTTFLIADGCSPANDGRGYVLRKILRRAALFSKKLTIKRIFPDIAEVLIDSMLDFYPYLKSEKSRVIKTLNLELDRFEENLDRGKKILKKYFKNFSSSEKIIDGEQVFKLYDTFGFPVEVTSLISADYGFSLDHDGFEKYMSKQKARSGKKMKKSTQDLKLDPSLKTNFIGYEKLENSSRVIQLGTGKDSVESVELGQDCWVIPEETVFYVESGGQASDKGTIEIFGKKAEILNLEKIGNAVLVYFKAPAKIKLGENLKMIVDEDVRKKSAANHTSTHLLQAAMQKVLGDIKQAGSFVTSEFLRFDFNSDKPLSMEHIKTIEFLVNQKVIENVSVIIKEMSYEEAIDSGIQALFGEKYDKESVRAVIIDQFSKELCCGTHLKSTGEVGVFKIIEESALAAGQRRLVAITGINALEIFQQNFNNIKKISQELKSKSEDIFASVQDCLEKNKSLSAELKKIKKDSWKQQIPEWINRSEIINNISFSFLELQEFEPSSFKDIAKSLQQKKSGLYFLFQNNGERSNFLLSIGKELSAVIDLKSIKNLLSSECGLRGGGSNGLVQGGGKKLDESCKKTIKEYLNLV